MTQQRRRSTGKALQESVARQAGTDPYRRITIRQIPDPVVITRRLKGGRVEGRLASVVGVDLEGRISLGERRGLFVAVECKTRHSDPEGRFTLDNRLREHQGQYLAGVSADGGVAAVYARLVAEGAVYSQVREYLIPVGCQGVLHGKASAKWSALERWRIPHDQLWVEAVVSPSGAYRWDRYVEGGGWEGLW